MDPQFDDNSISLRLSDQTRELAQIVIASRDNLFAKLRQLNADPEETWDDDLIRNNCVPARDCHVEVSFYRDKVREGKEALREIIAAQTLLNRHREWDVFWTGLRSPLDSASECGSPSTPLGDSLSRIKGSLVKLVQVSPIQSWDGIPENRVELFLSATDTILRESQTIWASPAPQVAAQPMSLSPFGIWDAVIGVFGLSNAETVSLATNAQNDDFLKFVVRLSAVMGGPCNELADRISEYSAAADALSINGGASWLLQQVTVFFGSLRSVTFVLDEDNRKVDQSDMITDLQTSCSALNELAAAALQPDSPQAITDGGVGPGSGGDTTPDAADPECDENRAENENDESGTSGGGINLQVNIQHNINRSTESNLHFHSAPPNIDQASTNHAQCSERDPYPTVDRETSLSSAAPEGRSRSDLLCGTTSRNSHDASERVEPSYCSDNEEISHHVSENVGDQPRAKIKITIETTIASGLTGRSSLKFEKLKSDNWETVYLSRHRRIEPALLAYWLLSTQVDGNLRHVNHRVLVETVYESRGGDSLKNLVKGLEKLGIEVEKDSTKIWLTNVEFVAAKASREAIAKQLNCKGEILEGGATPNMA